MLCQHALLVNSKLKMILEHTVLSVLMQSQVAVLANKTILKILLQLSALNAQVVLIWILVV